MRDCWNNQLCLIKQSKTSREVPLLIFFFVFCTCHQLQQLFGACFEISAEYACKAWTLQTGVREILEKQIHFQACRMKFPNSCRTYPLLAKVNPNIFPAFCFLDESYTQPSHNNRNAWLIYASSGVFPRRKYLCLFQCCVL